MRKNSKYFAQGSDLDFPAPLLTTVPPSKKVNSKSVLKDCKNIIVQLENLNKKLETQLKEKQIIIDKLLQQKQKFILHMANCDSQALMKELQELRLRQSQLSEKFREMGEKYEAIIQKKKAEIQKLKSYNRALRIDNSDLREKAVSQMRNRKIGSISNSDKKDNLEANSFSFTKINQANIQEELSDKFIVMPYQTPEKTFKTFKSTALPSTQGSKLRQSSSVAISSQKKSIPQNLFSNQLIRQFREGNLQKGSESSLEEKEAKVEKIMKRIRQILTQSDGDSY